MIVMPSLPNEQVASPIVIGEMRRFGGGGVVQEIGNTRLNREWREDDATQ